MKNVLLLIFITILITSCASSTTKKGINPKVKVLTEIQKV